MAPSFIGKGTAGAGLAAVTPTIHASTVANDLLILIIEGEGEDANDDPIPTGGAWTLIDSVASATDSAVDRTRCTVAWAWYAAAINRTVPDAGDHTLANIYTIRGANLTTPIEAFTIGSNASNVTSHSAVTGLTTLTDDALVVLAFTHGDDATSAAAWANTSLTDFGNTTVDATASGSDATIGMCWGTKATAGGAGTFTWTTSPVEERAWVAFSVKPASFDPDAISGITGWWDASQETFANNDPVGTFTDRSVGARNFTASGTARPTFKTNQFPSGEPGLEFDGTDDTMAGSAGSNFITAAAGTIVAVFKSVSQGTNFQPLDLWQNDAIWADADGYYGLYITSEPKFYAVSYDFVDESRASATITTGTTHIVTWRHSGGTLYASVDGGTETSDATAGDTGSLAGATWLGRGFDPNFANMIVGEIRSYNRSLTSTELSGLVDHLDTKWNVATTAPVPHFMTRAMQAVSRSSNW